MNPALRNKNPRRSGDPFGSTLQRARLGCRRNDADEGLLAGALDFELDFAVDEGEQRVILADADVDAGVHFGPALADDDGSRDDRLAAEGFDAKPCGLRIAAVTRAAACFFVCHDSLPLGVAVQPTMPSILSSVKP